MPQPRRKVLPKLIREYDRTKSTSQSFIRAATQRLDAARFLSPNYSLDKVYLAGYAVECSIKSLILANTSPTEQAETLEEISHGAGAHNIDILRGILARKVPRIPAVVFSAMTEISREWSTNLRYIGKSVPSEEAERFLADVNTILAWVERCQ